MDNNEELRATMNSDVDLELQSQMRGLETEVEGVLRRASERKRRVREGGGVLSKKGGKQGRWLGCEKQRGRERVEWGNRDEGEVLVIRGE